MYSLINRTKLTGSLLNKKPAASANVRGSSGYPNIRGTVSFFEARGGVVVAAEFTGLPYSVGLCGDGILAFHIHEGRSCSGTAEDPFKDTGGHYNPGNCPHPQHAGDMPPLFVNKGRAFLEFMTDRFTVSEIIGRTVIVHAGRDDFTSQPSGNAGAKIACGEIKRG